LHIIPDKETSDTDKVGILLLHGLTGMPSEMRPLEKALLKQGFQVKTPLLPGHGADHHALLASTWQDWLKGAQVALMELKTECDKTFVCGLSMGSLLATALAAEPNNDVSGLIMISTTLFYDGSSTPITRYLLPLADWFPFLGNLCSWKERPPYGLKDERLQRIITKAIEDAKKGEGNNFGLFETHVGALRQLKRLANKIHVQAPAVTCPSLIIHSMEDTIATAKNAFEIYNLLGSLHKSIFLLQGGDHVLTVDLCKEQVIQAVGQFIRSQPYVETAYLN
jgi:carboxylesterase